MNFFLFFLFFNEGCISLPVRIRSLISRCRQPTASIYIYIYVYGTFIPRVLHLKKFHGTTLARIVSRFAGIERLPFVLSAGVSALILSMAAFPELLFNCFLSSPYINLPKVTAACCTCQGFLVLSSLVLRSREHAYSAWRACLGTP